MGKSILALALAFAMVSPALAHEASPIVFNPPTLVQSVTIGNHHTPASVPSFSLLQNAVQTANVHTTSNGGGSASSLNLDLSSTTTSMMAGRLLNGGTLTVDVGGVSQTVNAQTALTPAEYLAVMQVRSGHPQSLIIDAQGSASGGSFVINPRLSQAIGSLMIPQGVTVIDLTRSGSINLGGSVTDAGSLYFTSLNPSLSTVSVNAANITVQGHGIVSDVLPSGIGTWSHSPDSNLNFSLTSMNDLVNAGTISSAGNLSLVVGSGRITNTGTISSIGGSINVATLSPTTDLNINAAGGTFQALAGNINLRDASYAGSNNVNLNGGNYLSQNLNIFSGNGAIYANIGQVTGSVNSSALIAHIIANTPQLVLGSQCLSGDPTYANTGDIDIAGPINITGGANLAIVAGGNILSTSSNAFISDPGGNVLLIAGAAVTGGGTGGAIVSGSPPSGATTSSVTVSLAGGTGGNIDFAGVTSGGPASAAPTVIDTSNASGNGGNITLVALANGATGGSVLFNTAAGTNTINASGNATGSSGQVTVFAGANSVTAIQTNNITTGGGNVTISSTQATTNDGKNLVIDTAGNVASLNSIVAGNELTSGSISVGTIGASAAGAIGGSGGAIAISTAGSVTANGGISSNGALNGGNGGTISISAGQGISVADNVSALGGAGGSGGGSGGNGGNGGAITLITASGDIVAAGLFTAGGSGSSTVAVGSGGSGGQIVVAANTGSVIVSGTVFSAGGNGGSGATPGSGGNGGAIIFNSGAAVDTSTGGSIFASGGAGGVGSGTFGNGGNAGSVVFTAGTKITTNSTAFISAVGGQAGGPSASNGNGGLVALTAGSEDVTVGTIATDSGFTGSGGIGGNVLVVAIAGNVAIGAPGAIVAAINTQGGIQGGSVAVSASGTVVLAGLDGSGDVINSSSVSGNGASVLIASGATSGQAITLDSNGNINTSSLGAGTTGNAWILSLSGTTHGSYLLNGISTTTTPNPNDFASLTAQSITGSSGVTSIAFVPGIAPTNFSPGGYSSINITNGQAIEVNTQGDLTLIVPIVSSGTFSVGGTATLQAIGNSQVALYGNQGIGISGSLTTDTGAFNLPALIDTSASGISISNSASLNLGAAATNGSFNLSTSGTNTLTVSNAIVATDVTVTAAIANFVGYTPAAVIATTGNITIQSGGSSGVGGDLGIAGNAAFITGPGGETSFLATTSGSTLTVYGGSTLTISGLSTFLQAPTVNLDAGSQITATASNGNITIESPSNGNLILGGSGALTTTSSGTTSLLSMNTTSSILTVADSTALTINGGGKIDIRTPNLVFVESNAGPSITATGQSQITIDGGDAASIVPLTITGPTASNATIATNGGAIIIHATGNLEFANNGVSSTVINLNANGPNGPGLVDIQGFGDVTIDDAVTLSTNSPIQINLNAVQTLALNGSSQLMTSFSGNSTFPDPLGGTFQYSILIQNLITNFNIAGTGTILQAGTTPGYTVFNDFIDVGFAADTTLTINSSNAGSFVNFFTRQIFVNGAVGESAPTAGLTVNNNVTAINFNTNLPAPGPGDVAFQPAGLATSATLSISGAPVNVGFAGPTPPISIPPAQQPLANIVFGKAGGSFALTNDQPITLTATSVSFASPTTIQVTGLGNGLTLQSPGDLLIADLPGGSSTLVTNAGVVAIQASGSVGFADSTNLVVQSTNPGGYLDLFASQIQVSGVTPNIPAIATISANDNIVGVNFNTILGSSGPNSLSFLPGSPAQFAILGILGAPINVGFPGPIPPTGIPANQQPIGNINFGLGGTFDLSGVQSVSMFASGNITVANASRISSDGHLTVETTTGSNGNIIVGGTISSPGPAGSVLVQADGFGSIVAAGGTIDGNNVTLSSGTGSIGSGVSNGAINTTANLLAAQTAGGNVFINQIGAVILNTSNAGPSGTFSLNASGIVTVSAPSIVEGGNVIISTDHLVNDGTIQSGSALGNSTTITNPNGALTVSSDNGATGTWVNPAGFQLVANGNLNVGVLFNGQAIATNSLTLTATSGVLTLPVNSLSVTQDSNGNGGSLSVTAAKVVLANSAQPFSLNADALQTGAGVGNGGSVSIDLTGTTPVTIGAAAGNVVLSAIGGSISGNGGSATAMAGNNLIVNPAQISVGPGVGGGNGGTITLQSNSKTAFLIDSPKATNGTRAALNISGISGADGIISVSNIGTGGVTDLQALTAVSQVSLSAGNSSGPKTVNGSIKISANLGGSITTLISLNANGTGKVAGGTKNAVTAGAINAFSSNGAITLPDIVAAASSTVNVSANTGSKGAIALTGTGTGTLNITDTNGASLTVKSLGELSTSGAVSAGKIALQNTATSNGLIDIGISSVVSGASAVTITANGTGSTIISAGVIGSQKTVVLSATKGDITVNLIDAGTTVKATAMDQIMATGLISGITGVSLATTSAAGPNQGSITVANIFTGDGSGTAGGAISVIAAGGTLTVNPLAEIEASSSKGTKASITLENKLITGATTGTIVVDGGAQITTAGTLGGNVNIVMGAVPASPKGSTLPTIAGVTFSQPPNPPNPLSIFVGATATNNGVNFATTGTSNPIAVSVTGHGVKVILNTGALLASAITIIGGTNVQPTTITADPPIGSTLIPVITPQAGLGASSSTVVQPISTKVNFIRVGMLDSSPSDECVIDTGADAEEDALADDGSLQPVSMKE